MTKRRSSLLTHLQANTNNLPRHSSKWSTSSPSSPSRLWPSSPPARRPRSLSPPLPPTAAPTTRPWPSRGPETGSRPEILRFDKTTAASSCAAITISWGNATNSAQITTNVPTWEANSTTGSAPSEPPADPAGPAHITNTQAVQVPVSPQTTTTLCTTAAAGGPTKSAPSDATRPVLASVAPLILLARYLPKVPYRWRDMPPQHGHESGGEQETSLKGLGLV